MWVRHVDTCWWGPDRLVQCFPLHYSSPFKIFPCHFFIPLSLQRLKTDDSHVITTEARTLASPPALNLQPPCLLMFDFLLAKMNSGNHKTNSHSAGHVKGEPQLSVAVELTPPLGFSRPIPNWPRVSMLMYLAVVALSVFYYSGNGPKDTLSLLWMEIVPSVAAEQRKETSSLALSDMSPMSPVSALTQL